MNYVFEPRINRYMLGCKSWRYLVGDTVFNELIDTCWDVNRIDVKTEASVL